MAPKKADFSHLLSAVSRRLGLADPALRDLRWLERARGAFVQQDAGQKVRDKLSQEAVR